MAAADNGPLRQNLDRALMLVHAFGYNPTPSEPESFYQEEPFMQRLIDNVVPFVMFFVRLFASIIGLGAMSILTYWLIYSEVIMRGLEVQSHPIFFDYSAGDLAAPIGRVDLHSTSHAPWVYSCDNTDPVSQMSMAESLFCVHDDRREGIYDEQTPNHVNEMENTAGDTILKPGQRYFVDIVLTLPESDVNKKLGVFMLNVDLRSRDGTLLARSKQSSLFPYESKLVGLSRKFMMLLPLISGVVDETKSLSLLCFDNYMDSHKTLSYAEISLQMPNHASYPGTTQAIQILSSEFHYGKMMSPLQRFVRKWWYLCAFIGTLILFIAYAILALHIASRRGWLLNRHAYYPAFGMFGSDTDSTYNFDARSHSWAGPDVEILDETDDNDEWEPLDASGTENVNESNIIPDDKSIISQDQNDESIISEEKNSKRTDTTFPLGPLSQNPSVQSHQTMFSSRDSKANGRTNGQSDAANNTSSTREEEKCLADMVMKGLSKFEVFTGRNNLIFFDLILVFTELNICFGILFRPR